MNWGGSPWQDVDLDSWQIVIRGAASKIHRRRITPLAACAVAWLKLGGELPIPHTSKRRYIRAIRDRLALAKWPADALRHTAASMMLAREQDAGKVALWLGNSPKILLSHYHHLSGENEARHFWNLFPREMQTELEIDTAQFCDPPAKRFGRHGQPDGGQTLSAPDDPLLVNRHAIQPQTTDRHHFRTTMHYGGAAAQAP
jgi:hypothetical protein